MNNKVSQQAGVTSYLNFGAGKGLFTPKNYESGAYIPRLLGIPWHRHFADNRRYVAGGGNDDYNLASRNELMVARSPQGWFTDEYLQLLKDNGVNAIWTLQGRFPWQDTIGKPGKVMPIMEADYANQSDPSVWKDLADFAAQLAIRYADDTAAFLDEARVWQYDPTLGSQNLHLQYLNNTPKAGLGLVDAIQVLNEPNFNPSWSGATNAVTAEGTAAAYYAVYQAVRKYSQTMRIITGPPIGIKNDREFLRRVLNHLKTLFGGTVPSDVEISFHWYMREKDQDQSKTGQDTGASPEFVDAYELGKWVNDLCHEFNIAGWWCTETGWSAAPEPDIDKSANAAPIQEGFTQLESQGILMKRLLLIWGSLDKHQGTTFWHCKDHYDSGAFFKGGLLYDDSESTPKPARDIYVDFIDEYHGWDVTGYYPNPETNEFYAMLEDEFGTIRVLGWSDRVFNNEKNLTPDPKIVTEVPVVIEPPIEQPEPEPEPTGSVPQPEKPVQEFYLNDLLSARSISFEYDDHIVKVYLTGSK